METISLKLDAAVLADMARLMKAHRYATKTEFIRDAIREKMSALEKQEALAQVEVLYGFSKRRTSDAQLHRARARAVKELFGTK